MTDPYDPYRQNDPYGQGPYGPSGGSYPGQPYQGGGTPYQQPDATRQFDPYGTQQFDPYGPPQQPYGPPQQPYQGSYGRPAGWGPTGPGGYPPGPPKRSKAPMIALAVLGAIVLIGGVVVAAIAVRTDNAAVAGPTTTASASGQPTTTRRPTTTRPTTTTAGDEEFAVGQCATLNPEDNNRATIQATDCGGLLSDVVIAKIQPDECAQPYLSFNPGEGKIYCLAMDAKEGDCFRLDKLIKRAIACDAGTHKVVKIFEGAADNKLCAAVPDIDVIYAYPDLSRTICLTKV
jgi:hypothetical protein